MECEVTSKTYRQIKVVPTGTKLIGEMQLSQKTLGFYLTAYTTAMLAAPSEEATLITDSESVKVAKKSGEIWVAGDPIFWIEASDEFSHIDDGGGYLVGKASQAAGNLAELGFVDFKDYYPVARGHQVGTVQIPYKMATAFPDPLFSTYAINNLGAGTVDGNKIILTQGVAQQSGYVKALRVHLESAVKLPASGHAIYGKIDLKSAGYFWGKGGVIGGELVTPASSMIRGTMSVFEGTINVPSGGSWGSAGPCAFIDLFYTGTGKPFFTANGHLFNINGEAIGTGRQYFVDDSITTVAGGVRMLINGVVKWLCYADN